MFGIESTLLAFIVLAGFSQGLGYAGAGIAPLLFGVVHDATGDWGASFALLGGCVLVMLAGAVMINRRRYIEDGAGQPGQPPAAAVPSGGLAVEAGGRVPEELPR